MCEEACGDGRPSGSRRRKLWDLDHKHHCQLVGVCFEVVELRRMVAKLMPLPALISDFDLHRSAVAACSERSRISELMHKTLEKRHALTVRQYRGHDTHGLQQAWAAAVAHGEIGGALWAILTHPACTETLEDHIYGNLHMIQHQVGSLQRRELATFQALQHEHATLLREMANIQSRASHERDQRIEELQELRSTLLQQQADKVALQSQLQIQTARCESLTRELPGLAERERLLRRARDAEAQCHSLRSRVRELESLAVHWQGKHDALLKANSSLPAAATTEPSTVGAEPRPPLLAGKQVLCIGGRPHVIAFYRQLVEGKGGLFAHHDGGHEENLARLEPSIAAADAVICQAGCINHNAYWRVKDYCKRTGKPCVFLKANGISRFEQELDKLGSAV